MQEKIFKSNKDANSCIKLENESITLSGDAYNRFMSTKEHGNFIAGPTVFTAHPENIKFGGVFRINGLNTSTMASTIITPIPMFEFEYPMKNLLNDITEMVSLIGELI